MASSSAGYETYRKVDVETASQGKLIVMLFNGAIQRAEEAKRLIEQNESRAEIHNNLIRAQEILTELRSALNMSAGEIAVNLDRIYEYFQHLLIKANIRKEVAPITECLDLMAQVRDAWQEFFNTVQKEEKTTKIPKPPQINPHGSTVMNLKG